MRRGGGGGGYGWGSPRYTVESFVSDHPECLGYVVAYGRWSLAYQASDHRGSKFLVINLYMVIAET